MNSRRLYILLIIILVGVLPCRSWAETPFDNHSISSGSPVEISFDSVVKQKQPPKKDEKKQKGQKADSKKPEIKEVPKSKRQIKPAAVKAKVKTPVKRVKPVIKKPVRPIRKKLGV